MITRRDCILLLSELEARGIDTRNMLQVALTNSETSFDVVRFINTHREFDANKFYEKLRKSYNHKRSDQYKNIVTIPIPFIYSPTTHIRNWKCPYSTILIFALFLLIECRTAAKKA